MKKTLPMAFVGLFISISLIGCGEADMEGLVLEVNENGIKLARDLSPDEYEKIKDKSVTTLQNEDVQGKRPSLHLINLAYDNPNEFHEGDEVNVWIDGDIMDSYPAQAEAKKVAVKK